MTFITYGILTIVCQAGQSLLRVKLWKSIAWSVLIYQLSSFGKSVPAVASDSCSWLTRVEPLVVFCFSQSTARLEVLCFLRLFSAQHAVKSAYLSYWWLPVNSK